MFERVVMTPHCISLYCENGYCIVSSLCINMDRQIKIRYKYMNIDYLVI